MQIAVLFPHPTTPSEALQRVDARWTQASDGTLILNYSVDGDIERLCVPAARAPLRADGLWRHTCFEAFVRDDQAAGYYELNFSPSGEWALYRFTAYRQGVTAVEPAQAPRMSVGHEPRQLQMEVVIDLNSLGSLRGVTTRQLGLSAVMEETNGHFSYWALAHPSPQPDFHHPAGFALEVDRRPA